jgi:fluoroacetyl-CoA thioesterase
MPIEPGLTGEMTLIVQESDTARYSGGESLPPVFSTPRVIGLLERTSHNTILPFLTEGQGSVGAVVNIRHLAATPIGFTVRTRAEVLEVEGRRVKFKVEAWDDLEKIAEGEHERYIIDMGRFIDRVEKKRLEHGQKD